MKTYLFAIFSFFILISSCYYDSEEDLYPDTDLECDTENVTFNDEIVSLLDNHCWACHSNNNAAAFGNNLRLEDYDDVNTSAEEILGSIKHDPSYSPMPKNGGKLRPCLINQFDAWMKKGTPEN